MAIQKELWINEIQENLYRGLEAIKLAATDDSAFVNGKTIHIPTAGAATAITKGNSTYPVSVSERTDSDNSYDLTNYEFGPYRIGWSDALQLSYDKTKSIVNDLTGGLSERVARELMIGWYHYTAGKYVATTGSSYAAHATAATGNRKGLTGADLRKAAAILDTQKIPMADRYLLVDNTMFWQLMDDMEYNAERVGVIGNGLQTAPGTPYGFTVIAMPAVIYATSAGVVREYGDAGATTDQAAALALHKSAASWALTDTEVFEGLEKDPAYFGTLISGAIYGGGKYRRYDKLGIVPIIQANA
jgi:hypothetical protein